MAWERLEGASTSHAWAGPLCTAEDAEGQELLFMVGGSSASRAPRRLDFEEVLGEDQPMDLWTRPMRGGGEMRRSVVAFPPKPRAGGSLTALSGRRLLLFGGRSGRENKCLADVHILQLGGSKVSDRSPASEDSDSEAEPIFFASDYRAACAGKKPKAAQPKDLPKAAQPKVPQEMVKRRNAGEVESSESEAEVERRYFPDVGFVHWILP
eukprot:symbB.v1.2.017556.t1/scaffold1365.1/size229487/3